MSSTTISALLKQFYLWDEKDKKIQELTTELRVKKRLSAAYHDQLLSLMKDVEDHNEHLLTQVQFVLNNLKELGAKRSSISMIENQLNTLSNIKESNQGQGHHTLMISAMSDFVGLRGTSVIVGSPSSPASLYFTIIASLSRRSMLLTKKDTKTYLYQSILLISRMRYHIQFGLLCMLPSARILLHFSGCVEILDTMIILCPLSSRSVQKILILDLNAGMRGIVARDEHRFRRQIGFYGKLSLLYSLRLLEYMSCAFGCSSRNSNNFFLH
ncbi:hypothetical protein LOK49_LG05G01985 [Camellia lanceoleosa]|uniref:Uncharacterized protein n=1 Tax=Camellia lanceoleosa TaxID=1840588 RepID=A0ACC0HJY7_9ERIC|nr:hypothetical protein LOK49_LG05G01985 [Camellia lanceoleosa]